MPLEKKGREVLLSEPWHALREGTACWRVGFHRRGRAGEELAGGVVRRKQLMQKASAGMCCRGFHPLLLRLVGLPRPSPWPRRISSTGKESKTDTAPSPNSSPLPRGGKGQGDYAPARSQASFPSRPFGGHIYFFLGEARGYPYGQAIHLNWPHLQSAPGLHQWVIDSWTACLHLGPMNGCL